MLGSPVAQIKDLFVQVLLIAERAGVLKLGNISLDGTKIHANASKSKAVSYQRLLELEKRLQAEVEELLTLAQQTEEGSLPEGLVVETEIAWRQKRLLNLREAKAVLTQRAAERYQAERKAYEQKIQGRVAKRAVKRVENLEVFLLNRQHQEPETKTNTTSPIPIRG